MIPQAGLNDERRNEAQNSVLMFRFFGFCHSGFFRHSSFGFRRSALALLLQS